MSVWPCSGSGRTTLRRGWAIPAIEGRNGLYPVGGGILRSGEGGHGRHVAGTVRSPVSSHLRVAAAARGRGRPGPGLQPTGVPVAGRARHGRRGRDRRPRPVGRGAHQGRLRAGRGRPAAGDRELRGRVPVSRTRGRARPSRPRSCDVRHQAEGPVARSPSSRTTCVFPESRRSRSAEPRPASSTSRSARATRSIVGTTSGEAWWSARMPEGREDLLAVLERVKGRYVDPSTREHMTEYEAFWITHREAGSPPHQGVLEALRHPSSVSERVCRAPLGREPVRPSRSHGRTTRTASPW